MHSDAGQPSNDDPVNAENSLRTLLRVRRSYGSRRQRYATQHHAYSVTIHYIGLRWDSSASRISRLVKAKTVGL